MKKLRLGTRGSKLALTQSRWIAKRLQDAFTDLEVETVVIKTMGDRDQKSALSAFPGKGIFTKEIEEELLRGGIDFAVHSLKDLPTELPAGLTLAPPPLRADHRDVLVAAMTLRDLPLGAVIGTGSARRAKQLQAIRPDLEFRDIRGNVPTRVRKWREGSTYDAIVLAAAGVARLGFETCGLLESEVHHLPIEQCLPAPGQGVLGIEMREGDDDTLAFLKKVADPSTEIAARAERAFLARLEGGCHIPAGAFAEQKGSELVVRGLLVTEADEFRRYVARGRPSHAAKLGTEVAEAVLGSA